MPEDFIAADFEFKKMLKAGSCSAEDLGCYGILHHQMARYCIEKALDLFDKVIEQGKDAEEWICLIAVQAIKLPLLFS